MGPRGDLTCINESESLSRPIRSVPMITKVRAYLWYTLTIPRALRGFGIPRASREFSIPRASRVFGIPRAFGIA